MDSIRKIVGPGHARGDVGDQSLSLAEIAANLD